MTRILTLYASRRFHELAELSQSTGRQSLPPTNPTVPPSQLHELARARRTDADQKARFLAQRGGVDDVHSRFTQAQIDRLRTEAQQYEAQADAAERRP